MGLSCSFDDASACSNAAVSRSTLRPLLIPAHIEFFLCPTPIGLAFTREPIVAPNPNMSNFWIGLIAAAVLICGTIYGLWTGQTWLLRRQVTRPDDAYLFWLAICLSAATGVAALVLALSDLH